MPNKPKKDPFYFHKIALRPLLTPLGEEETEKLLKTIESLDLEHFFSFLQANRLEHLWRNYLSTLDLPATFDPWMATIRNQALPLAAHQLKEEYKLRQIHQLFERESIPYFIFKGVNLRHTIYQNQTLRSSCDIDIFVPYAQKLEAVRCLASEGYRLYATNDNVSFEVSMFKDNISIDLHWYFLRQGRTRIDMTDYLFASREKFSDGLWGLNPSASLFVMLVHPVFNKHIVSPTSMLIHMVDLYRLLNHERADWQNVLDILDQSGMRTAAWCSLYLLSKFTVPNEFRDLTLHVQPGSFRRRCIKCWIEHELTRRFFSSRLPIRSLFSLALQDRPSDAVRAISVLKKTLKKSERQMTEIQSVVANKSQT